MRVDWESFSLEELSRMIGTAVKKQRSRLKGKFTVYIVIRLWQHAIKYHDKYKEEGAYDFVSLDDCLDILQNELVDEEAARQLSNVEFYADFQRMLEEYTPTQRKTILYVHEKSRRGSADTAGRTTDSIRKNRNLIAKKMKRKKEK